MPFLFSSAGTSSEQFVPGPQIKLVEELAAALNVEGDGSSEWEIEPAAKVDRTVRILPGARVLLESIPKARYAVVTSRGEIYGALLSLPLVLFESQLG